MSILEQAKAVQGKRKKRYGDADKKRNSKIRRKPTEKNLEVWSRNPGRSDIIGVDGEGTPTLKRDQEPTPRPKRKKAAPKRKKAEVKPQAKPAKKETAEEIKNRIVKRGIEKADEKEKASRSGYKVISESKNPGYYEVRFTGKGEEDLIGSVVDKHRVFIDGKPIPKADHGPEKTRFSISLYDGNRRVYADEYDQGFPGFGYAIMGTAQKKGLLTIKADYKTKMRIGEQPKRKKDNPESIVDNLSPADRKKVSMKIDELARMADEARAKGEAAPNYNLCEITLPGTNIYCEGNKGIERAKMPQFKGTPVPGSPAAQLPKDSKGEVDTEPIFRKQLKVEGIAITPKEIYSDNLKATQSELVGAKVAGMTKALEKDPNHPGITAPIFVSNDNYVIDGHHRWAAVTSYAIKNGLPKKMKVEVIDLPIEEAIKKSNEFADMIGIAQKAAKTEEAKPEAVKPEETKRRKKEGGVSARKRRKEERKAAPAPTAKPEPIGGLGSPEMPFDVPSESRAEAKEALDYIQDIKENFANKFVKVGEARAGVSLAYERFWRAAGSEAEKNAMNLAAHIAFVGEMPKSIRPKYPEWGTFKIALGLSMFESPFVLSDQWSNRDQALPYILKVIQGMRIPTAGKMRQQFLKENLTVEDVLQILSPITPRYIGNDDLRPSMDGVNINMNSAVAMTNGHVLFFGRFRDLNFDVPVVPMKYIGNQKAPDLANKTTISIDQQKREQTYFWRDSSNSITIIPPEQKSKRHYPFEILEEKYPNYFGLIPVESEDRKLNRTNTFAPQYMERLYKTFLMMKEYGLIHTRGNDVSIVHAYFSNQAEHNNVASYEARYMEAMLFTARQFNTSTHISYDLNPWKNKLLVEYILNGQWYQRALTLMMPNMTGIEEEKYPFFRRPQDMKFASGGVIDEVELVDNSPFDTKKITGFPDVREVVNEQLGGPSKYAGQYLVVTTKQSGEFIRGRSYNGDQLQQAMKDIVLDMARGFVVINLTSFTGSKFKSKGGGDRWREEMNRFGDAIGLKMLDYIRIDDIKEWNEKRYERGGRIEKRKKGKSYTDQLQEYPDFTIQDSTSEIVDVGDYRPEGGIKADTPAKAAKIIHDFYDPDMKRTFEQVIVLYVDKNKNATHIQFLAQGNQTSTVMDPSPVMNVALQTKSPYIYIAHNHPSGNPKPSAADRNVATMFKKSGEFLGITILGNFVIPGTPDFKYTEIAPVMKNGGYVEGPSHEQGGVKMPVGSSGRMVELEGGEGVVNKRSMASQKTITLNGKRMKPCQAVSQINQMDGNGVPITC